MVIYGIYDIMIRIFSLLKNLLLLEKRIKCTIFKQTKDEIYQNTSYL